MTPLLIVSNPQNKKLKGKRLYFQDERRLTRLLECRNGLFDHNAWH